MTTFGLHLVSYPDTGPLPRHLDDVCSALEASPVFSTLWLADHMQDLAPDAASHPMPESYLLLAAVAGRTSTLRLGVLATSVMYRQPALLAKMITTLDVLSAGRAILGIGAGHPRTGDEHAAYGCAFPSVGARMRILDEALSTIRAMVGATVDPTAPPNWPRPVQADGIPILVAGSGEQCLLRIAARHADMVNLSFPSGDTLERLPHKLDVLARHCATVGRDPAQITVTYKALLAVGRSRRTAQEAARRWCEPRGITAVDEHAGVFVGEPDEIAEQVRPFLEAGVDHLVVELAGGADGEAVNLASEALSALQLDEVGATR